MDPKKVYKFCLRCGKNLVPQEGNSLKCSSCGVMMYINPSPAVGIILENAKGEILLTKRARDPGKGRWDLPGGFCNPYETAEETALREAEEELGVKIEVKEFITDFFNTYTYAGVDIPALDFFFHAKIIKGDLKAADDVTEVQFFAKDEVLKQDLWAPSIRKALETYLR